MAYKQNKHLFQGMNRDLSDDKQKNISYIDAHNIRITAREDTTLLSVTNEKGNKLVEKQQAYGTYIGHAVLNKYLVLFTIRDNKSYIWRITIDDSLVVDSKLLYSGNLGFDRNYPIETLVDYETEEIQKVYWVDGINQPRLINIVSSTIRPNVDTQFDFIPEVFEGADNLDVQIEKLLDNEGIFAAGTIQYFISYYSKFGQETNIVWQSPLLYISPKDRGGNVSETIANSFKLTIGGASNNFDYLRIYSIQHTSQDTDLIGRRVIDIKIPQEGPITYIDRGISGDSINPADLFYIGGMPSIISTMSAKDQVLFLGNITLNNTQKLSDELKNRIKGLEIAYDLEDAYWLEDPSGKLYSYTSELHQNGQTGFMNPFTQEGKITHTIRSYKYLETYRFGLQFQDKWGKWTEPYWIGDVRNTKAPTMHVVNDILWVQLPVARLTSFPFDLIDNLLALGYVKVRPLVVLPNEAERECVAQGVICPTVYNLGDRQTNSPFSQPSWFFRPYSSVSTPMVNETPLPFRHNSIIQGKVSGKAEIEKAPEVQVPPCIGATYNGNPVQDTCFFVDQSIVTLNSPDIEFNDTFTDSEYSFRLVGVIDVTGFSGAMQIHTSTPPNNFYRPNVFSQTSDTYPGAGIPTIRNQAEGYLDTYIRMTNMSGRGYGIMGAGGYWFDAPYTYWHTNVSFSSSNVAYKGILPSGFRHHFTVYPWQASGSLNNTNNVNSLTVTNKEGDAEEFIIPRNTANLRRKILANLRYSSHTQYFDNVNNYDIVDAQVADSTINETIAIKVPHNDDKKIYYSSIDKLLPAPSTESYNSLLELLETFSALFPGQASSIYTQLLSSDNIFGRNFDWDTFIVNQDSFNSTAVATPETSSNLTGSTLRRTSIVSVNQTAFNNTDEDVKGSRMSVDFNYDSLISNFKLSAKFTTTAISYRSTKHAVISLDNSDMGYLKHCTIMPIVEHIKDGIQVGYTGDLWSPGYTYKDYGVGSYNNSTHFYDPIGSESTIRSIYLWGDNAVITPKQDVVQVISNTDTGIDFSDKGVLLIGEIYRPTILNKFGGDTDDAIQQNVWIPAGESINLSNYESPTWKEGDTYFQRYDCLKTYPYSNESMNNIVEILSFMCETRVNIDGRYDKNRGLIDNTFITNENFNLLNKGYTQNDNFFSYKVTDDRFKLNKFSTQITWTKSKVAGAFIDNWTNLTLQNTLDLDGNKGGLVSLNRYNNDIVAFQPEGISQIKFNQSVQISTNTGEPIELANSGRVEGKRYLYENIGCQNKWSICENEFGVLFFMDNYSKSIFRLDNNGIVSLTDTKGFREWMEHNSSTTSWIPYNDKNYGNSLFDSLAFRTFYDKTFKDVYFVNDNSCLVYSELLGQFVSFMDYNGTNAMFNIGDNFYSIYNKKKDEEQQDMIYHQFAGMYNNIYDTNRDYYITFIDNQIPEMNKVFTNLEYRSDTYKGGTDLASGETFNIVRVFNEYQDSDDCYISTLLDKPYLYDFNGASLQKKFRVWRIQLPRDSHNPLNRINNTWTKITLKKTRTDNEKTVLHDALVGCFV